MNIDYKYLIDRAYQFLSVHRKVTVFDPRFTDNSMILDNYNDIRKKRDDRALLYSLVEHEYTLNNDIIPVNYMMLIHEINMAWTDIIHEMLFEQKSVHTFCGEYGEIVAHILTHLAMDDKDTLVYRGTVNGITPFHLAAKTWLMKKLKIDGKESLESELQMIFDVYQEVGAIIFDDSEKNCILEIEDFYKISLKNHLTDFIKSI